MAAPGRFDVNVRQGRRCGTDQQVSTLVSTIWAVPAGSAGLLRAALHALGVRDPAEVRRQVRTAGTHSGVRTEQVRTGGSHSGSQPLT